MPEYLCEDVTLNSTTAVQRAWSSITDDRWELPQNCIYSAIRVGGEKDPTLSLLTSYKRFAHARKIALRILSVLIAQDIDQFVEMRNVASCGEMLEIWAQQSGMSARDIKNIEQTGRWYMDFLDRHPRVGLGALLMLGNNHSVFGKSIPMKLASAFAGACMSIEGFKPQADKLAPYVYEALVNCAGQCGLIIDPTSRLGMILAREQQDNPRLAELSNPKQTPTIDIHERSVDQTSACLNRTHPASVDTPPSACQSTSTPSPASPDFDGPCPSERHCDKLVLLLCHFGPRSVPIELLQRAFVGQYRWDQDGKRIKAAPQETGLGTEFEYFEESTNLERCLSCLSNKGKIETDQDGSIHVRLTFRDELLWRTPHDVQKSWRRKASAVVCHAFPRGQTLDAQYPFVGRRLAPLLQWICESGGDYHACENLAETVLAAGPLAHFDTRPYVELFLQTIPFNHLHVWAIRQVLRKKGHCSTQELQNLFEDVVSQAVQPGLSNDMRMNAQIGRLRANFAVHLSRFATLDQAEAVLSTWAPINPTSTSEIEQSVADRISLVQATILRYRGEEEDARHRLEALRLTSGVKEDAFRAELIRNLLELTLDLKYVDELPVSMCNTTQREMHTLLNRADTHFDHGRCDHAATNYAVAAERAGGAEQRVRALIGVAKSNHCLALPSAEQDWLKVERLVMALGWNEGFAHGLIKLSLGILTDDMLRIEYATQVLLKPGFAAWVVGGQSWARLVCRMGRKGGPWDPSMA
ncbi:hypothetical protein LTR73_008833 [Friedmanniomyces endolithicus]|nr:hypothetical protein LTR73_008833 [Friedmanniomyces endolithicus]